MKINFDNARVYPADISVYFQTLIPLITKLRSLQGAALATDYAFLDIPEAHHFLEQSEEIVKAKKKQWNPELLLVIGIGGSSTGARAVKEALQFYGEKGRKCIFLETVDVQEIVVLYEKIESILQSHKTIIIAVISKSGTTTETLVNASIFVELLKKYCPDDYRNLIITITDKGSVLWQLAEKEGFTTLEIPQKLGGRFSIFSPVGLLPLVWCDIPCRDLLAGARAATKASLELLPNDAVRAAVIFYEQYKTGKYIHDIFVFSPSLLQLGAWYRQLIGESLGKRENLAGAVVEVGITPTVSLGSHDLHSVAQLYIAGPRNKITTFIQLQAKATLRVPVNEFSQLGTVGAGKTIAHIQEAFLKGTYAAYVKARRPALNIELIAGSAYDIGYCMQQKMFETVYLAALFAINPFNQPAVELYKKETRILLDDSVL